MKLISLRRGRALTEKKCTKKCNVSTKLLFWRPRCRRRTIERWCFVSNGNADKLIYIGKDAKLLESMILHFHFIINLYKKKPRVLTYLDLCPKAGVHSRKCYERTRMIYGLESITEYLKLGR